MCKGHFNILIPRGGRDFLEQADDLFEQLEALLYADQCDLHSLLQARFYVSDATNQCEILRNHEIVGLLESTGVVSYIEQPPLCGAKIALLLWSVEGTVQSRRVSTLTDGSLAELTVDGLTYIMQTVRFRGSNCHEDSEEQTKKAFESHIAQLEKRGMNLRDHCQRTWIYVRDVDRNYSGIVKARNDIFAHEGLTSDTHYISSTGIGGASEDRNALVAVDFFSVLGLDANQIGYLHALDYLNPTHEYGVAFERGTYLDAPLGRYFFLSGTASIDKNGECVHRGDVMTQAGRLFLNIEKLLESAGGNMSMVGYFLVYLRDVSDYRAINTYMHLRFPNVPFLITEARVCRPEWLMEVECIAYKKKDK